MIKIVFDGTEREAKDPEPEGSEPVSAAEWGYGVPAAHMHGRVHQCRAMWPGTQQKQGSLQKVLYMQKPPTPDPPLCYLWKKGTGRLLQLQEDVATPPPTFVHLWSTWSLQSSSMQVLITSSLSSLNFSFTIKKYELVWVKQFYFYLIMTWLNWLWLSVHRVKWVRDLGQTHLVYLTRLVSSRIRIPYSNY